MTRTSTPANDASLIARLGVAVPTRTASALDDMLPLAIPPSAQGGEDSLRRRYLWKMGSMLASAPLTLAAQSLAMRGLGPAAFGQFSFLTTFFQEWTAFLDAGTSSAYFTKLSRRPAEHSYAVVYFRFVAAVAVLSLAAVAVAFAAGKADLVWHGANASTVVLALGYAFSMWLVMLGQRTLDAHGLTVGGERFRVPLRVLLVGSVVALFATGTLTLRSFLLLQIALLLLHLIAFTVVLRRAGHGWRIFSPSAPGRIRQTLSEYRAYAHPLIAYGFIAMMAVIGERWLLQQVNGSFEQGYYGLAVQISGVLVLFTVTMAPLFTRELAVAQERKDAHRERGLMSTLPPTLFFIAAALGGGVIATAPGLVMVIGGGAYLPAVPVVAALALFPAFQSYGQMAGSVFHASGRTAEYRNWAGATTLAAIPLTVLTLAPAAYGGLGAGAWGLAVKTTVAQAVIVNLLWWRASASRGLPISSVLRHQCVVVGIVVPSALLARTITDMAGPLAGVLQILLGGAAYCTGVGIAVLLYPRAAGISGDILPYLRKLARPDRVA